MDGTLHHVWSPSASQPPRRNFTLLPQSESAGKGWSMKPLTLEDMRAEGVHSVTYDCLCRPANDTFNVDHLPADMPVPEVREHIRCGECGEIPLRTIPLWAERGARPGKPDTR